MTRIRASCPHCSDVEVRPADVALTIVRDTAGHVTDGSTYRFRCPSCTHLVAKPADARIAALLSVVDVKIEECQQPRGIPGRARHPESPPTGPRLTYDDLLDLHLLLTTDSWFEQLEAG